MAVRNRRAGQSELRELQRRVKDEARLSALQQARLEVDAHEKLVDVLLSIHKEASEPRDWKALAFPLRPPRPTKQRHHEMRARRQVVLFDAGLVSAQPFAVKEQLEKAEWRDESDFRHAIAQYDLDQAESERRKELALRVLSHDVEAFRQALQQDDPLVDLAELCVFPQPGFRPT